MEINKSIHQTMFREKRQMGNVLEIVIFVIRTFLVEAATHLGPFYWKKQLVAGRAGQHVLK